MPSLTYLSTIRKYYSTSSPSSYVCTPRHVGNSQKRHGIDGPKMEQERQMLSNVWPTFSDMSPTCRLTRQCRVKIADANIQQTQLSTNGTITVQHGNKIDRMNIRRVKPFEEDLDDE
jgi:hypothetical protein